MPSPNLTRIAQILVAVTDLPRAIAFYRDILGLQFLFQAPPGLAFFMVGGVRLMLALPEAETKDHHTSILYYETADIQASAAELKSRGVTFEGEPHKVANLGKVDLWLAAFRDSEGNLVALLSEVPV